jgi:hypothetical protein
LVVEVEARGGRARGGVARTIKHNLIDCLWVKAAFARGGSTPYVESLRAFAGEGVPCEKTEQSRLCLSGWSFVWLRPGDCFEALTQLAVKGFSLGV